VLNRNGFDTELLNGDLPQKERERVMAKVKRGEVAFMVATDIAARGIDISDLGHVINYSLPEDPAVYLHRVGRTGRIGKKGIAINLVSGRELNTLSALEKRYGIVFEKRPMPSPEEAIRLWTERHVREIRDGAAGSVYEGLLSLAAQLKQRTDADDLIAFLLKYFFTHHRMEKVQAAKEEPERFPAARPAVESRVRSGPRKPERPARRDAGPERKRSRPKELPAESPKSAPEARPGETASEARPGETDHPQLWLNLGKSDGLDSGAVVTALEAAGAPPGRVVRVSLRATYSYLSVAEEDVAGFEALSGRSHGDKVIRIERAKRRR